MTSTVRSMTEPLAGYRLLERLGSGGFGEVWKAEAPGGILKAIKIIRGDLEEDDGAQQEYKALQRVKNLQHPFLLTLERADVVEGQLVIVMELAECNLMQYLEACQARGLPGIPRDELLRYIMEAAEALDFMNEEHHLQHLDVKPQNLFLIRKHLKVADFGLSKDLEGTHAALSSGITPTYAAPETFEACVSHFCDQYSLAIVYQELLTGKRPFDGKNARHLLMQHLTQEPDLSSLPVCDRASVARALAKEPGQRFPSCLDFVRSLSLKAVGPEPLRERDPETSLHALLHQVQSADQTPPARKPLTLAAVSLCPRCGTATKDNSNIVLCANCGYSSTLPSSPAAKRGSAPDDASWTWGLLAGVIVIAGTAVLGDSLTPLNSEARALCGLGQLLVGASLVIAAQIAAVMVLVSLDGGFGLKDAFVFSGRLWVRVIQCLPTTRWPVYLLTWGLLLTACGLCLGDLSYWARYHRPRKSVENNVQRSLQVLDEKANRGDTSPAESISEDLPEFPPQRTTATESGAPVVQCVVVGYVPREDGNSFSGVMIATLRKGKLVQTTVIEQGFTPETREELFRRMERMERPQPPKWWRGETPTGVVWVQADSKDSVVCELECDRVDESSGKLANVRFRGLARK